MKQTEVCGRISADSKSLFSQELLAGPSTFLTSASPFRIQNTGQNAEPQTTGKWYLSKQPVLTLCGDKQSAKCKGYAKWSGRCSSEQGPWGQGQWGGIPSSDSMYRPGAGRPHSRVSVRGRHCHKQDTLASDPCWIAILPLTHLCCRRAPLCSELLEPLGQ